MAGLRDYELWHREYDDPDSELSWRLRVVQRYFEDALGRHQGPIRVLSCCSGEGRDVLGVLGARADAQRVTATLIEIHPAIAQRAREAAAGCAAQVEVREADAGVSDSYVGAVPADIVLMVGMFGNISNADLERTIVTAPQFCRPGATLLWSRGRDRDDRNDLVRDLFGRIGFTELDYAPLDAGSRPAAGAMRFDGQPVPLVAGTRLFTFLR